MLSKSVTICFAASLAVAAMALLPSAASAAGRGGANWPMEGTWNWPPYAGSEGGMPGSGCGYVLVKPYHHRQGQWIYRCR
jgi:hypothetical protein